MSLTRWPGLSPRIARSAAVIDEFGDAFEAVTSISSTNLGEEGIDIHGLATGVVGSRDTRIVETTRATISAATGASTWTTWDPTGANPFLANVTLAPNDGLLMEAAIQFSTVNGGTYGIGSNSTIAIRFAYTDGAGLHAATCPSRLSQGTVSGGGSGVGASSRRHGCLRTFYYLSGADLSGALLNVRLQYVTYRTDGTAGGVSVSPARSSMIITRLRRP